MAKILIADDSFVMRRNLKSILTDEGHQIVAESANGMQACIRYDEMKPDLVTMDITMPGMDGIEATKKILEKNPDAKIIMISALDQKRKVFEALDNGAKHYIIKPITKEKVIKIVNEVLIAEGVSKKKEPKINKKEEKPREPFTIENDNGTFIVSINETLDVNNFESLNLAIKGFLFVKPLKITFKFTQIDKIDKELLVKFDAIIQTIKEAGGEYNTLTDSKGLVDYLRKEGSLLF